MNATTRQIERFEAMAARVFTAGLKLSAALLAAGLACWIGDIDPWSTRILEAGLLVLMATPAARVTVSLVAYALARDWFFVATTAAVLAILCASVVAAWITR